MDPLTPNIVLARLIARLDPHFLLEGFARSHKQRPGEVHWTKSPDDAPGEELDRVSLMVGPLKDGGDGCAVRGLAWSWTRAEPVNLRTLAIEHREPGAPQTPSGWLLTSPAAVSIVAEELETLVHGQLIGWLDEPVPLGGSDGSLLHLPASSEQLLGGLIVPGGGRRDD